MRSPHSFLPLGLKRLCLTVLLGVLTLILLNACIMSRHREQVRNGVLMTGLNGKAFLEEWGPPTRTSTMTGEEAARADWAGGSGFFSGSFTKGKQSYDVWDYGEVMLVFEPVRGNLRLVAWKSDMNVAQLRDWSTMRARSR